MADRSATQPALAPPSSAGKLAEFFPDAIAMRIPVQVTSLDASGTPPSKNALHEQTVIEFGTPQEVFFASSLPLEFDDKLRLENSDGSLRAEASVVAVQYHEGRTAVAARFCGEISNWIVKR